MTCRTEDNRNVMSSFFLIGTLTTPNSDSGNSSDTSTSTAELNIVLSITRPVQKKTTEVAIMYSTLSTVIILSWSPDIKQYSYAGIIPSYQLAVCKSSFIQLIKNVFRNIQHASLLCLPILSHPSATFPLPLAPAFL